jgi:hypothetical protein
MSPLAYNTYAYRWKHLQVWVLLVFVSIKKGVGAGEIDMRASGIVRATSRIEVLIRKEQRLVMYTDGIILCM